MKTYKFLDESKLFVDDSMCRGCFLERADNLPIELTPIWMNDFFVIRQDAECPVPGFFIVSTRQHIHTIGDLPIERASELGVIINRLRDIMSKDLGIKRIHVFLEERLIEPHLHIWMLPLWPNKMKEYQIDPKIWNSNIYNYIMLFSYEENKDDIIHINQIMRQKLANDSFLLQLINKNE